ncbi:MAG: DUF4166 domain-containing protein [Pseudomonadota bacterium]
MDRVAEYRSDPRLSREMPPFSQPPAAEADIVTGAEITAPAPTSKSKSKSKSRNARRAPSIIPSRRQSQRTSIAPGPFEKLLSPGAWRALPQEVRKRFAAEPGEKRPKIYAGHVVETKLSIAGHILARVAGLIGTPLPETNGATGPSSVSVAHNAKLDGQIWTRIYGRADRFPQVVHSVKRFQGPTGLEEFVGPGATWGIGMTLRLSVENSALVFRSDRYFVQLGSLRMTLPRWLSPGEMAITHRQLRGCEFQFLLELEHAVFGPLIRQDCIFADTRTPSPQQPAERVVCSRQTRTPKEA